MCTHADFVFCLLRKEGKTIYCSREQLKKYLEKGYVLVKEVDTREDRVWVAKTG